MIRTFQPTVRGSDNPNMPSEFDRFIRANWDCVVDEAGRAQADFRLGFAGMRKIEMRRLAEKYQVELDEDLPGEEMKAKMEGYFREGKFPIPDPQSDMNTLMQKVAELESKLLKTPENMSWEELKAEARKKGVFDKSLNREELIELVNG